MLLFDTCRPFFRLVAIMTILTFFPSAVGVWNAVLLSAEAGAETFPERESDPVSGPAPYWGAEYGSVLLDEPGQRRSEPSAAFELLPVAEMAGIRGGEGDPAALLAEADAQRAEGNIGNAFLQYLRIIDDFKGTPEAWAANNRLEEIKFAFRRGDVSMEEAAKAVPGLPTPEEMKTAEGVNVVNAYYYEVADYLSKQGDKVTSRQYYTMSRDTALSSLSRFPGAAIQIGNVDLFLDSAKALGGKEHVAAARQLRELAYQLGPCMSSWAGHSKLGQFYLRDTRAHHLSYLRQRDLIAGHLKHGYIDDVIGDPSVYVWVKAEIEYALGIAYWNTGDEDAAIAQMQRVEDLYPGAGQPVYLAGYAKAFVTAERDWTQPAAGVRAFNDYLEQYPDTPYKAKTLLAQAAHVMRHEDYSEAVRLFRRVVNEHPGTAEARQAAESLDFMMAYLVGTYEVASAPGAGEEPERAQVCGPAALQKLLMLEGVSSTLEELGQLAETDQTGTSMLGLVKAAKAKGITLVGVQADDAAALPTPFIAHVNNDHFVLVTDVAPSSVTVADIGRPARTLSLVEFIRMWQGRALVKGDETEVAELLALETLRGARGGTGDPVFPANMRSACENHNKPCVAAGEQCAGGGCVAGGSGGAGANTAAADGGNNCGGTGNDGGPCGRQCFAAPCCSPPPEMPEAQRLSSGSSGGGGGRQSSAAGRGPDVPSKCEGGRGGPGTAGAPTSTNPSPSALVSFSSPGVNASILTTNPSLNLMETDLAASTAGPMKLEFRRTFSDRLGLMATDTIEEGKVWGNNIGANMWHGYNVHLVTTDDSPPSSIGFMNALGNIIFYDYSHDAGGMNVYMPQGDNRDRWEASITLERDTSTGRYTMVLPDGLTYAFSAESQDADRRARLETIEDAFGNAVTLSYDGANNVGKLTKVSAPAGDPHYFRLYYSGYQITKVELRNASSALQTVEYAYAVYDHPDYGNIHELTKVTDNAGATVHYSYGTPASWTKLRYIDQITNKAGEATQISRTLKSTVFGPLAYKITVDDAAGLTTEYDTDPSTYVSTVTCYDGATMLRKVVYRPGPSWYKPASFDFYYDSSAYLRWSYEYVDDHNLTRIVGPGGDSFAEFTYTANGRYSTATYVGVGTTVWGYASASALHPTRVTYPSGAYVTYEYDASDVMTKVTSSTRGSNGTTYAYDALGNLTSVTDPLGKTTAYAYNAAGRMTSVTDALGNTTASYYDEYGNLTRSVDALNNSTYYYYDVGGCGGCSGGALLTKVTDALGNETEYEYDSAGRQTKVIDALDNQTAYAYGVMGRLTRVTTPDSTYVTMAYDKLGRVTAATDPDGHASYSYYDVLGWMTKSRSPEGIEVSYSYDTWNNLSTVTDGNDHTTVYEYANKYQLTKVTDPIGKVTRYFHDAIGRATKVGAGASGGVDPTEYFYDASTGALTQVRYMAGANTYDAYYYYDGLGRLTKISDWMGGGGLRYAFDGYGRMTRVTDYDGEHLDYAFNSLGQVTSVSDYHSNTTTYAYDGYGRMTAVTAPGSKTWTYNVDAYGRTTKVDIPNGMDTHYAFDAYGRMTSIEHKDGAAVLDGWTYGMDGGAITAITAEDGSRWAYEHDANSRLTKAERYDTDGTTLLHRYSYTYDDGDNLLTKAVLDAVASVTTTTAFAYNDANELVSQAVGGTTTSFAYDAWGRMTAKSDGTYTATYAYRYGNKLASVTSDFPSEGNATYQYDGAGKRRQRTAGGATTKYRWDRRWTVMSEEDAFGDLTRTYVGRSAAHVDGTNPSTGTWRFYVHDHLGSTRGVYNSDKTQYAAFEHDPYGELYASSGSISGITRRYTGHDWDDAAELYYAPYRYYAAGLARWISRDPHGMSDGPNCYAYVRGASLSSVDRLGQQAEGWPIRPISDPTLHLDLDDSGGYPYMHCLNSCVAAARWGHDTSEWMFEWKEAFDWWQCFFLGRAGSCQSALQDSDYTDNRTGRNCACQEGADTTAACRACCTRHRVGPGTREGRGTERPDGPVSFYPSYWEWWKSLWYRLRY